MHDRVYYSIWFLNHEDLINLFNNRMHELHWYSIVNKNTGTEILINFNCYQCNSGSTCLQNDDDIFFIFFN